MKNLILTLGGICLIANIFLGLILSCYHTFNIEINSVVIVFNTLFIYLVAASELKDAFKISLSTIFPLIGIIEFVIGLFASETFENNLFLIVLIICIMLEAMLFAITYMLTKINK